MALADAWEHADGWPPPVADALSQDDDLTGLELLVAFPEYLVPLPGGRTASQTDLFVLARNRDGALVTIAVEGKAAEPFGDSAVSEWRATDSPGRRERLAYLLDVLGLDDDDRVAGIRYQLLNRTASGVIEARRFSAHHALMLVHSFSPHDAWLEEFLEFAALYGAQLAKGTVAPVRDLGGITLHRGWVSETPRRLEPAPRLGPRLDRALALAGICTEIRCGRGRRQRRVRPVQRRSRGDALVLRGTGQGVRATHQQPDGRGATDCR